MKSSLLALTSSAQREWRDYDCAAHLSPLRTVGKDLGAIGGIRSAL